MANGAERKLTKNPFFRGFLELLTTDMKLLIQGRRKFLDSHVHLGQQREPPPPDYDSSNLPMTQISVKGGYANHDAPVLRDLNRRKPVRRSIRNAGGFERERFIRSTRTPTPTTMLL